jgi:uncharacterized membrane protein YgcG
MHSFINIKHAHWGTIILTLTMWGRPAAASIPCEPRGGAETFRRVVVARAYQKGRWMLGPKNPKDVGLEGSIAYVCEVLGPLKPTFVSGLFRFGGQPDDRALQAKDAKMLADFLAGVRQCLPGTKFDVVLNAKEYTPDRTAAEHVKDLDALLHPDGWYFDFFSKNAKWDTAAVINWAHANKQFVGGTIWGKGEVPQGADYIALDTMINFDKMLDRRKYYHEHHKHLRTLMHIENSPTDPKSDGMVYITASEADRRTKIERHARAQQEACYDYMYPVLFPIGLDFSTGPGAFDPYRSDRSTYDRMKRLMCAYNPVPGDGGCNADDGPHDGQGDCHDSRRVRGKRAKGPARKCRPSPNTHDHHGNGGHGHGNSGHSHGGHHGNGHGEGGGHGGGNGGHQGGGGAQGGGNGGHGDGHHGGGSQGGGGGGGGHQGGGGGHQGGGGGGGGNGKHNKR